MALILFNELISAAVYSFRVCINVINARDTCGVQLRLFMIRLASKKFLYKGEEEQEGK